MKFSEKVSTWDEFLVYGSDEVSKEIIVFSCAWQNQPGRKCSRKDGEAIGKVRLCYAH